MKVAVACDGLAVASHATQCSSFMCYTIDRGVITDGRNLPNLFTTVTEIAKLLHDIGIDVLIAHEFPQNSIRTFEAQDIECISGAFGDAREAVDAYLSKLLLEDWEDE